MLLCKIMLNLVSLTSIHVSPSTSPLLLFPPHQKPEDVNSLLTIKISLKYTNMWDVESMHVIVHAYQGLLNRLKISRYGTGTKVL